MKSFHLPTLVGLLTFYCVGTTFFEAFVNYRAWPLIDAESFPRYHAALTTLVVRVMLIPIGVTFLASLGLLVWPSGGVSRPTVALSVALQALAIGSSILVQIPLQMRLRHLGPLPELMARLVWTDLVWRKLPLAANALLWLLALVRRP
jgi:hypothetical protein